MGRGGYGSGVYAQTGMYPATVGTPSIHQPPRGIVEVGGGEGEFMKWETSWSSYSRALNFLGITRGKDEIGRERGDFRAKGGKRK